MRGDRDAVAPSGLMKKKIPQTGQNWNTERMRLLLSSKVSLYIKKVGRMDSHINPEKSV